MKSVYWCWDAGKSKERDSHTSHRVGLRAWSIFDVAWTTQHGLQIYKLQFHSTGQLYFRRERKGDPEAPRKNKSVLLQPNKKWGDIIGGDQTTPTHFSSCKTHRAPPQPPFLVGLKGTNRKTRVPLKTTHTYRHIHFQKQPNDFLVERHVAQRLIALLARQLLKGGFFQLRSGSSCCSFWF